MGMFDNIEDAQTSSNGGSYVKPGHYLARIDRVKAGISQQDKKEFVAIEMTVLASLPDGDIPVDADFSLQTKDAWHRSGENVSHLLMSKHASFQSNFKAFVANVGGIPEGDIQKSHCEKVTDGCFEGLFVEVRARTIKTRAGNPFTVVGYSREVPPSEISERVDEETLARVLGPGKIEELVEAYGA